MTPEDMHQDNSSHSHVIPSCRRVKDASVPVRVSKGYKGLVMQDILFSSNHVAFMMLVRLLVSLCYVCQQI